MEQKSNFYSLMVVGEQPEKLLKRYDKNNTVEPYVKYYYKDAGKLKDRSISILQGVLDNKKQMDFNENVEEILKRRIKVLQDTSDFEYYSVLTEGMSYDEDGNAETTENPDGKFTFYSLGVNNCIPLILKDGAISYQARVKDVDWKKTHMVNEELYRLTWKLFKKEKEPETEQEKRIYDNVKHQKRCFIPFQSEDEYVRYNCSYWNYAYVDKDGWHDADESMKYDWIIGFYDKYVANLNDDDLVTIYKCYK